MAVTDDGTALSISHYKKVVESDRISSIITNCDDVLLPKGKYKKLKLEITDTPRLSSDNNVNLFDVIPKHVVKVASLGGARLRVESYSGTKDLESKRDAMVELIENMGLSKEAAEHVFHRAIEDDFYNFIVKGARATYIGDYDPEAPDLSMDDNYTGYEEFSGAPITEDMVDEQPVAGLPVNRDSDYGELDPDVYSTMEQAVATNQKDIFDVSVLASLLKVSDVSNLIDDYLSDIVRAVDRFGRMLFLLYSNSEDMSERYGTDNITELEDSLKNAFTTIGNLVLFLKQRSIASDVDGKNIEL
jgi:hypothetical protein